MSTSLESVMQQMAELTTAIKTAKSPKTDLQWDDVKKQFGVQLDQLVETQVKAALDRQPVYRVPGQAIMADGEIKNNRYSRFVKSFVAHGDYRDYGQRYKPVDLLLAKAMLDGQVKTYSPTMGGAAAATPSDDLELAIKALTSTGAGTGDELVPTNLAGQLWEDFFLASRVAGQMTRVDMPTNPFDVPLGLGNVTWRKGSENTATTASDPSTAKTTLTATELITEQNWSYTLDEDAAIALAPALRNRLAQSGGEIMDSFALNADATSAATGNINLDDSTPAAGTYYLSDGQDGIRHQWLVDNTAMGSDAGGDALADDDVIGVLGKLGKYAVDPNQLVLVCDVSTYLSGFLKLANVLTVDKFGPNAIIHTGQLASYRGVPIVLSASHPLAEADGKVSNTGGNNTLGSFSVFHKAMWYIGFRRNLLIETDRDIQKRMYVMVTSLREAVAAYGTRSTAKHTGGARNILV